jgi:muramoyltetrapeptide carboxypeptidase
MAARGGLPRTHLPERELDMKLGVGEARGMLRPPRLRPGDPVRVIAPSGPFDRTLFYRALGWLSRRYRVSWDHGILARVGFLAGDDERRFAELDAALADPALKAVFSARGGYGSTRICHKGDFSRLRRAPKWLVGFSDFTALHLEASRAGVCSLHAPNLTALGRADERARQNVLAVLESERAARVWRDLRVLCPGTAEGVLAGGNLCLIANHAASARLVLPERCILFFEEVNEAPYRIDRMLTSLLVAGHFARVVGVCVGQLTGCGKDDTSPSALDVIQERLAPLGVPVLADLPIGHGEPNEPLVLGDVASLDANTAELVAGAPLDGGFL